MSRKSSLVLLSLAVVALHQTTHSFILRPDLSQPPFMEDTAEDPNRPEAREERSQQAVTCPNDMTEYECYHTFMAVWTRLLQKDKRMFALGHGKRSLQRLSG